MCHRCAAALVHGADSLVPPYATFILLTMADAGYIGEIIAFTHVGEIFFAPMMQSLLFSP